ncbi:MAG: hypothetical protein CYG60_14200 [Actinobacteria bacterium]|nr:MAG: hypothetical protein CYG60_14200 [Actinomycetota bacterium]
MGNQAAWREWAKTEAKPQDIPASPAAAYPEEWRGWGDWLGVVTRWSRGTLLAFLEDLRPRLPHLEERELYAILQQGGAMPTLRARFGGRSPLKVIGDLKENTGRGIESAILSSEVDDGDEAPHLEGDVADTDEAIPEAGDVALAGEAANFEGDGDVLSSPSAEEVGGLPALASRMGLRVVDELTSLPGGLDDETAAYLVGNRVAALWEAWIKGEADGVREALAGEGGHYFNLIRERFEAELTEVESLPVPDGYRFSVNGKPAPPNAMQKRTAWEVLTRRRVGNWSGAGAGKTLSAVLASRVAGCEKTLVVANNSTVSGWGEEIKRIFPDSVVHHGPEESVPGAFNYWVINYEKFQQSYRGGLVRRLAGLGMDLVVLDEVQMVKQRTKERSLRREALEGLVYALGEQNPDLRVLGMSATPVINTLYEGRKLLEVVLGRSFGDLDSAPTVANALAVHRALMVNGFRYRPPYEIEMKPPEVLETERNDLLDDLVAAKGVLGTEQAVLAAKLEAAAKRIRPGTLIYTHYTQGMVGPIRRFVEGLGYRVGEYTGADKSGLEAFKERRVDVLIGSQPVSTGVDGLQYVCDRIVVISPPWTGAEYEQLLGRVRRQGSAFSEVSVVWPQVVLDHNGDRWSWDAGRKAIIEFKRTLSDCAVDGNIPQAMRIAPATLLHKSREALEAWIERISEEGPTVSERAKLEVPLPPELRERVRIRVGDFTTINNRWVSSNSETVHGRLEADPSEWYLYHTLYREAREAWPELPAEHIASYLRGRPDWKVGDFGCGEGLLKKALPHHEIIGLDHVAIDDSVIACDMAHAPLEDESLGAAVFSLSLMGRNWPAYLAEAHRTLRPFGLLFVAEPARRWEEGRLEQAVQEHGFEPLPSYQRGDFRYVRAVKGLPPSSFAP